MNPFAHLVTQQMALADSLPPPKQVRIIGRSPTDLEKATLEYIKANPNQGVDQIAAGLSEQAPSLYAVIQRLKNKDQITGSPHPKHANRRLWRAAR